METPGKISIVSPVYQAAGNISQLVSQIMIEISQLTDQFEIILVEDGSTDTSWDEILASCKGSDKVKGLKLSRNFGQHYAVTAGLEFAQGDIIIIMDCDLQDDPAAVKELYAAHLLGNDIVFTKRINRKQSLYKLVTAKIFNLLFRFFSDRRYDVNTGSMVLFTSRIKNIFLELKDKDRLYIQLLKWIGFKQAYVSVEHKPRFSGYSSYNFLRLLNLAVQGWTSHSDKLLRLSVYGGFALSAITLLISIGIIILYFVKGFQPGWPSLFIAIIFSTGLVLMSIGIAGIYIGKIFEQTKDRPLYIVERKSNLK
jgi:glycosyltransferase involved in cell wall biosynthesis